MKSPDTSVITLNDGEKIDFLDIERITKNLAVAHTAMVKRMTLIETLVVATLQLKIEENRG
jgi:hypothetical protein